MKNEKLIVGADMICPVTKQHCDDECCPVGAECNLSPSEGISPVPSQYTQEDPEQYNANPTLRWRKIDPNNLPVGEVLAKDLTVQGAYVGTLYMKDNVVCLSGNGDIVPDVYITIADLLLLDKE